MTTSRQRIKDRGGNENEKKEGLKKYLLFYFKNVYLKYE
jgi:hypothetical protein